MVKWMEITIQDNGFFFKAKNTDFKKKTNYNLDSQFTTEHLKQINFWTYWQHELLFWSHKPNYDL